MDIEFYFKSIEWGSILTASLSAIYGISSWRREAKWKRKYELAEEVSALFYECKEHISFIRHPFSVASEGKSRKQAQDESEELRDALDKAYIFRERYEKVQDPFIKLQVLKFRFITVFGKQSGEPFEDIRKIINEILNAAARLGNRYWRESVTRRMNEHQLEKFNDDAEKFENIVWDSFEDDQIVKKVDTAIQKIEDCCLLIMKK